MSDELVTWLRAQIDDDAAWALACSPRAGEQPRPWRTGVVFRTVFEVGGNGVAEARSQNYAEHIARHDPARVLREVEAKRRILDELVPSIDELDERLDQEFRVSTDPPSQRLSDGLLRLLALPYADRPGYRDEWRPA